MMKRAARVDLGNDGDVLELRLFLGLIPYLRGLAEESDEASLHAKLKKSGTALLGS